MTNQQILAAVSIAMPLLAAGLVWLVPRRRVSQAAMLGAIMTSVWALIVVIVVMGDRKHSYADRWIVFDDASALLITVITIVGLVGVAVSPAYLRLLETSGASGDPTTNTRSDPRVYFSVFFIFWATLVAVPLAGNLAVAWVLIEATTATSAFLVGFSGKPRALEAGWKYLVLTSLGLGVALLGITIVATGIPDAGLGGLSWHALTTYSAGHQIGMVAYLLIIAGLAAKIGWAPVHNWLPDAHSEAPAPVSAMLSAAVLPTVMLVAWRCQQGLAPAIGADSGQSVFIILGLLSIGVAVPFLGKDLPFKRLLAYSSLEHMGIIALGIGFAGPLALAGVALHVLVHAIAKTVGFATATPLLAWEPQAATHPIRGVARAKPALGVTMAVSLVALAGLPPSPLFVSELLIIAGGFESGHPWAAASATGLIALAFLGLLRATLDTAAGEPLVERGTS